MKRAIVTSIFLAGLMAGTAIPVSGLGGTQITLNCDDGTSLTAVVDADTVTALTQSVQALINYPAGLSCTLIQTPVVRFGGVADATEPIPGFVNGGGRFQVGCSTGGTFWVNLAVNAQIQNGRVVGTVNEAIPDGQCVPPGTFKSTPTCLRIFADNPNIAWVTSKVTETSGPFYPNAGVTVGSYARFSFQDNGNPGDKINAIQAGTAADCPDESGTTPAPSTGFDLLEGNITVRQT